VYIEGVSLLLNEGMNWGDRQLDLPSQPWIVMVYPM
jgi:hypothetical protein